MEDQKPVDKSEDIKLSLIEVEKALDLLLPLFTFEPEDKPAEKPE
tara:strand:+ start:586 stop:720 length:135 start_codon:yes stop_codon:yes gene_type:complete